MKGQDDFLLNQLQGLLGDQYRFEGVLGEGGSATVFRVTNRRLDRFEAIKVLHGSRKETPGFGQRFTHEAKLAAALDHPNIVKVYDFGIDEGIYWYAMQYIDGPTLESVLLASGPLSERAVAQVAVPILDALDYIHQNRVIHRDIKPANIILDRSHRPYLMDFGIARSADSMKLTQTGVLVGTPVYLPPEVVTGLEPDGRSDLYSLAVTFYELLTAKFPFPANTTVQAIFSRLQGEPVPLSRHRPEIDPRHEAIIMRALEREPPGRFATAGEMRDDYLSFLRNAGELPGLALEASFGAELWAAKKVAGTLEPAALSLGQKTELPPVARSSGLHRRLWGWGGAGALFTAALLLALFILPRNPSPAGPAPPVKPAAGAVPPDVARYNAAPPQPAATSPGKAGFPEGGEQARLRRRGHDRPPEGFPPESGPQGTPFPRRAVQAPMLLSSQQAPLPEGCPDSCRGQSVSLFLLVKEDGRVKSAEYKSASSPECGKAAVEAVKKNFLFKPALDAQGKPVEASLSITVYFY